MNSKKVWSWMGMFMAVLIITLPFQSADALAASVQITKNSGEKGIDKFIDAQGDAWTVQATITGAGNGTVDPKNVRVKIGDNEAEFQSCTDSPLGMVCEYISPLTDGVKESEHAFQVLLYSYDAQSVLIMPLPSNGDLIKADGSAPKISGVTVSQDTTNGGVNLDFIVNDKVKDGAPAVGLAKIEIVDADSANVLQTIEFSGETEDTEKYDFGDSEFGGKLDATFSGDGLKRIKIRAADKLGHEATSGVYTFSGDFVKPEIKSINFSQLGKFIGAVEVYTNIQVDVVEKNDLSVLGYSESAKLDGTEATCESDVDQDDLWHCLWKNVEVKPVSNIEIKVVAKDSYGNSAEKTLNSGELIKDESAPQATYFGSERMFEGNSYVSSGNQRIILKAKDSGAGLSAEHVRANLGALGEGSSVAPTECADAEGTFECYWDTTEDFTSGGAVIVSLSKFEDNTGNIGEMPETSVIIDEEGPLVEKLVIYGSDGGNEKDYISSNDRLRIKLTAIEVSGLAILVNLNDIVADAESKFPINKYTREVGAGWLVFTEEHCTRAEEKKWNCILETPEVKSGPDKSLQLEIKVQDTAGSDATQWPAEAKNAKTFSGKKGDSAELGFDLLGLSNENNPDYWEVSKVVALGGDGAFVDLDTTQLTYPRLSFKVGLKPLTGNVKAMNIEMMNCQPKVEVLEYQAPIVQGITETPAAETPEASAESSTPENTEPSVETLTGMAVAQETETPTAPQVNRALLYGGTSIAGEISPVPTVILEFAPFDGKKMFDLENTAGEDFQKHYVNYVCNIQIFSRVGEMSLQNGEMQEIEVSVPFGFSRLGAQDEMLAKKIKDARDEASTGFWGVIGKLQSILKWVNYIAQTYLIVVSATSLFNGAKVLGEPIAKLPAGVGTPAAIAYCMGMDSAARGMKPAVDFLQKPVAILSCTSPSGLPWYDTWAGSLIKGYNDLMNVELLKSPDSPCLTQGKDGSQIDSCPYKPVHSIKDNMYLSVAGLCLPGIIQNLDKYRQIKCRYVMCLEKEVPAGLATIESCGELESLLTCKYFVGELWYIFPFSQFLDKTISAVQAALRDPIAVARTANLLVCTSMCMGAQPSLSSTCSFTYWIWDLIDFGSSVVGLVFSIYDDVTTGGLQYCDSMGLTW